MFSNLNVITVFGYSAIAAYPDMSVFNKVNRPVIKLLGEDVTKDPYDEQTLIDQLIATPNLLHGLSITPDKLSQLPTGYVKDLYTNLRYGIARQMGVPLRDGQLGNFNMATWCVDDYLLAIGIMAGIHHANKQKLLPVTQYETKVALDYLKMLTYLVYQLWNKLGKNFIRDDSLVVISHTTEIYRIGEVTEKVDNVYLNSSALNGRNVNDLAQHWLDTGTQP